MQQSHIISQLKIVRRYSNLILAGVTVYLICILLIVILFEYRSILNIPFLAAIITCLVFGPLLGEIFCAGENEKQSYCLAPWVIHSVIFSKSIVLIRAMIIILIPILIASIIFFRSSISEYLNAFLYFFMAIPIFLIWGNLISIKKNRYTEDSSSNILFQFLMFIISIIPYLIFKVWLQSIILCFVFCVLSFYAWYRYLLPFVVNKFRIQNYNLQTT